MTDSNTSNGANSTAFLKAVFNHAASKRRRYTAGAAAVAAYQHARLEPSTAQPATRPDFERDLYAESAKVTKQFICYTDRQGVGAIQMAYNPTAIKSDGIQDNDPFTPANKSIHDVHPAVLYTGEHHREVAVESGVHLPFQEFGGVGVADGTAGGHHYLSCALDGKMVPAVPGTLLATTGAGNDKEWVTTGTAPNIILDTAKEFAHRKAIWFEKSPVKPKDVYPATLMAGTTQESGREALRNTARKVHRLTGMELRMTYSGPEEFRNGTIWVVQPERNESVAHLKTVEEIRNHPTARSHSINSLKTLRVLMQKSTANANKYHSQSTGFAVQGSNTYSWKDAGSPNVGIYIEMPSLGCYQGTNGPIGLPFECEVSMIYEYAPIVLDTTASSRLTHTQRPVLTTPMDAVTTGIALSSNVLSSRAACVKLAVTELAAHSSMAPKRKSGTSLIRGQVKRARLAPLRPTVYRKAQPARIGSFTKRRRGKSFTLYTAAPSFKRSRGAVTTRKRSRASTRAKAYRWAKRQAKRIRRR